MTINERAMAWLTAREIDVEVADRLGVYSEQAGLGDAIVIPTFRAGKQVARKYRLLDGSPKNPDQRWSAAKGGAVCFWNEDVLRDASLDGQPLIITEGHWDAMVAIQCGFQCTVSVPNGAPEAPRPGVSDRERVSESDRYAFAREVEALLTRERFPEIILATDADGPGRQLMHDLSLIFGRYRCRYLDYGAGAKDLNDVLRRDGAAGVVKLLAGAQFIAIPGVFKMSELPPLPPETIYSIGSETRGMALHGESYRMRLGDIAVVTGVPSYGKTTWLTDMVCRVVDHYGVKVGWASFEQVPQRDHKRNLTAWWSGKDLDILKPEETADEWIERQHVFIVPDENEDATLDWLLDAFEGAVVRHGCKILIADPWNEIEHRRSNGESETEYIGWALRTLKRFAKKFQVHLIIVAHPAKLQKINGKYGMPSLYDIAGSANFYNKCDVGVIVHREEKDITIIKFSKVKYHGLIGRPGEISVAFNGQTQRFSEVERLA